MGEAERVFAAGGTWRTTMDMVLTGENGSAGPEFKHPSAHAADRRRTTCSSTASRSPRYGGHWVEFSRPFCAGEPSQGRPSPRWTPTTSTSRPRRATMKAGTTAHDVHMAVSKGVPRPRLQARPRHRPLDRDDDDRVPADRRGQRVRAAGEHGRLDAPARDHPGRAARASTCRTRGASRPRAGCRSRRCRSGSSAARRGRSGDSELAAAGQAARQEDAARPP